MTTRNPAIVLDGASLTLHDLVAISRDSASVEVGDDVLAGLDSVRERLVAARESGAVYGANTGVGANRGVSVVDSGEAGEAAAEKIAAHAMRLLRSHCVGFGPIEDEVTARAAMVVRLNQILAGGSGISSTVGRALLDAVHAGATPTLHRLGGIGTGDLSALAELALTLAGERPWLSGGIPPVVLADSDGLPFMSSSALTIATAGLATHDLSGLMRASTVVAALSFLALEGSVEAYDEAVHRGRSHPHQAEIARQLRDLIGPSATGPNAIPNTEHRPSARLQDPFGVRVVPQVQAPAVGALRHLASVIETELNAAVENPLISPVGVRHHGQFHLATLASALDNARTSVFPALTLSAARLALLLRTDMTGLPPFLSADAPGSSGLMITEYVVQDVLAGLRVAVAPVSGGNLNISLGMEEHASFATQGARLLREVADSAPTVIAIEAVAAVRALRLAPERLRDAPARAAFDFLAAELDDDPADRPLGDDIERASRLLPGLGRFVDGGV